jgi:hypothetical protein
LRYNHLSSFSGNFSQGFSLMKHIEKAYPDGEAKQPSGDEVSLEGFIGYLRVDIFIPHSRSLKERRQVIERLKQRIRNSFNISLAEKPDDRWQKCGLLFACANYTRNCAGDIMGRLEDFIRQEDGIHIIEVERGIL